MRKDQSRDQGESKAVGTFTSGEFAEHAHSLLSSLQRMASMKGENNLALLLEPAKLECTAIVSRGKGEPDKPA